MNWQKLKIIFFFLFINPWAIPSFQAQNNELHNRLSPINGVTLGLHSKDYQYDYKPMIEQISHTNATWIGLTVKFDQFNSNSNYTDMPLPKSEFWNQLRKTIRSAQLANLKVFLSPIIQLKNHTSEEWRGNIHPENPAEWFAQYRLIITSLAKLAEEEEIDMISIGSELSSLQMYDEQWNQIIESVRSVYTGLITYSLNWDAIEDITFFHKLDILGISGYYQLSNYTNPSKKNLLKSWNNIRTTLKKQMEQIGIPYFFAELGYRSVNGANREPWNHSQLNAKVDISEQYDCYWAFTESWKNDNDLMGVFFYDWFGAGGLKDNSYTPQGKPALDLLNQYFALKAKNHNGSDTH